MQAEPDRRLRSPWRGAPTRQPAPLSPQQMRVAACQASASGSVNAKSIGPGCRSSARSRQQLPRSSVSVLSLVPGSCASLVGPGRLRPAPGCGRLVSATRLVQGGPGALASPALERRHDPAKGVVVVQQVDFGAEAALRIPGEPLGRERLEPKRRGLAAAAPGRAVAAATALAQV